MSPGFDSLHPPTGGWFPTSAFSATMPIRGSLRATMRREASRSSTASFPRASIASAATVPARNTWRPRKGGRGSPTKIRASIVNPARLTPKLRMDICLQCHLEPTSTAIPSLIRRFNRGPFSFRPGEPLADFLLAFDHAPGSPQAGKFEIVGSSAYRLRQVPLFPREQGGIADLRDLPQSASSPGDGGKRPPL